MSAKQDVNRVSQERARVPVTDVEHTHLAQELEKSIQKKITIGDLYFLTVPSRLIVSMFNVSIP